MIKFYFSLDPDEPVQILKVVNLKLSGAFAAHRPAAAVSRMDAYRFVYPEKGPEFLSVTTGT